MDAGITIAVAAMAASYLLPVATRRWRWVWGIVILFGAGLTLAWWAAPQAGMVLSFLGLAFAAGLVVRLVTAVIGRVLPGINGALLLAIEMAGLLVVILQLTFGYPIIRF